MKKFIIAALSVALGAASLNAIAATATTGSLSPSLLVTSACTVANAVIGQFSSKVTGAAASTANFAGGNVTVVCATPFWLGANMGTTPESTASQRYLTNGGVDADRTKDTIAYELSINMGSGVAAWGDMGLHVIDPTYTDTTSIPAGTAASGGVFPVTGLAHFKGTTLQNAGTYNDVVTITIAY
jgi:spore coat protein U-like protein